MACVSLANLLLHGADAASRLVHATLTAPLVWLNLLPAAHPSGPPSEACHVVVTGASTGIGRDAARALRRAGFSVWAGVRKPADADSVRAEGLIPLTIDVADDSSVDRAFDEVRAVLAAQPGSRLVAVVANAGVIGPQGPVEFAPLPAVREVFETNVFGVYRTVKAFLPLLREAKGRIVIVGSLAGFATCPGMVPYCMTKHAIESLADGLRRELGHAGVSVSLLEPGPVQTPIVEKTISAWQGVDPNALPIYAPLWKFYKDSMKLFESYCVPVSFTSAAVLHAITSSFPLHRYRVTWPAYFSAEIMRKLPVQVEDAIVYGMSNPAKTS